jgi:hypothetical protein
LPEISVVVSRDHTGQLKIVITGRLAVLLGDKANVVCFEEVAGAGLEPNYDSGE